MPSSTGFSKVDQSNVTSLRTTLPRSHGSKPAEAPSDACNEDVLVALKLYNNPAQPEKKKKLVGLRREASGLD